METARKLKLKIRIILIGFTIALFLSGMTAFPLVTEVQWLKRTFGPGTFMEDIFKPMAEWIDFVHEGILATHENYPYMMYGTDWLAFAHIVLTIAFLGAIRNPVRNIWIVELGMIACLGVFLLALICGHIRGIPGYWQFIDCCFGIIGIVPLYICRKYIKKLEQAEFAQE